MIVIRRAPPVRIAAASRPPLPAPRGRPLGLPLVPALCLLVSGCGGPLSTLDPSGSGAARVASLFYVMITVAALVWLFVMAFAIYAARTAPGENTERTGRKFIVFGGILVWIFA